MMRRSFPAKTQIEKNVCGVFALLLASSTLCGAPSGLPNGRSLIEKSLEAGERNEQQLRSYTSRTSSDLRQLTQDGSIKSEEMKTFDDVVVDGFHVRSLVAKDDKPLNGADLHKEQGRLAKLVAQRKQETRREREKRVRDAKEKREEERRFSRELLDAFDFSLAGEESIGGRKTWILNAEPHAGYQPKELKAQMFPHLRGRVWIDAEDLLWVKAEADAFTPFSVGFSVIAKLDKGAHLSFEQVRQPDGTWVVRQVGIKASGRIALIKRFSIDSLTTSVNFRKVPEDRRIGDGKDDF